MLRGLDLQHYAGGLRLEAWLGVEGLAAPRPIPGRSVVEARSFCPARTPPPFLAQVFIFVVACTHVLYSTFTIMLTLYKVGACAHMCVHVCVGEGEVCECGYFAGQ